MYYPDFNYYDNKQENLNIVTLIPVANFRSKLRRTDAMDAGTDELTL